MFGFAQNVKSFVWANFVLTYVLLSLLFCSCVLWAAVVAMNRPFARMYSTIRSSSRYLTLSPRAIRRRAIVELTSFETQFVINVMLRRYFVSWSELKINCSGLEPLRVMTTIPCWPRMVSSWN